MRRGIGGRRGKGRGILTDDVPFPALSRNLTDPMVLLGFDENGSSGSRSPLNAAESLWSNADRCFIGFQHPWEGRNYRSG